MFVGLFHLSCFFLYIRNESVDTKYPQILSLLNNFYLIHFILIYKSKNQQFWNFTSWPTISPLIIGNIQFQNATISITSVLNWSNFPTVYNFPIINYSSSLVTSWLIRCSQTVVTPANTEYFATKKFKQKTKTWERSGWRQHQGWGRQGWLSICWNCQRFWWIWGFKIYDTCTLQEPKSNSKYK